MRGKRQTPGRLSRAWKRLSKVPHLYGKLMVLWCVVCGTAFSLYALRILSRTGHDATGLLGVIMGFFGGELLLMCARNIFKK